MQADAGSENLVWQATQTIADINGLGDNKSEGAAAATREGLARVARLASDAVRCEEKLAIVQLLFPWLDATCDAVVKTFETMPIPPVGSQAETRLQGAVRQMLPKLWDMAGRFAPQVCAVTQACISVFQSRFLGADTFEFGDFVHTSHWLGKGTEGVVQLGFQISRGGQRVAIKKIERTLIDLHHWEEALEKGFQFLQKADHPSIVKLYHVAKLDTCWYVYMEFIDGGDLRSYLCKQDPSRKEAPVKTLLSEAKAKEIFRKLVEPVDYLRRNGVIHRDLKPANFMLTRSGEVKLVDFATMRADVSTGALADSIKGTPAYMAPEIWLSSKQKYDGEKVDVWSMGVILYEMVCGALPWVGEDIPSLFRNFHKKPLAIPPGLGLSKELCDLLVHMLKVNAQFRMTWVEVVGHAWLQEDPLAGVGNFLEESVNQLQLQVEKLQAKCRTLEMAQEQKDNAIRELSRELQQRTQSSDEKQRETHQLLLKMKAHADTEAQLRESLDAERNTTAQLNAIKQRLEAELDAVRTELEVALKAEAKTAQISELTAQVEQVRAAAAAESAKAQGCAKELAAAASELQAHQAREEELKQKILLATRQVVQLQERLDKSNKAQEAAAAEVGQLRQSQAQLFLVQQRCVAAEKDAADARLRAEEAVAARDKVVAEFDHLRATMEDVLGNLGRSGESADLRAQIEELHRELERRDRALEEYTAELAQRRAEIEHFKEEAATFRFLVEESNQIGNN